MSAIIKRFISYVGKTALKDLPAEWQKPVNDRLIAVEKEVYSTQMRETNDLTD